MHKDIERVTDRLERKHLERKAIHLRRELRDWPMTDVRREAKRAELHSIRIELLGARA